MKSVLLFIIVCLSACSGGKYTGVPEKYHPMLDRALSQAGQNAGQLNKALVLAPDKQKEGMAFLIAYMPDRDLKELNAAFLLENVDYAYKAHEQFPWAKEIPDSVFLNDVLPYVCLNETREGWRKDFYNRFSKYVSDCRTIEEAIDSVNRNIRNELLVDYNTKREKPDQSPFESIRQGMASCTGLSILLTDAFRAVGIPSRVAGTPNWYDERGNHNWTEVWAKGNWYFTEYYFPGQLNNAWFFADAGKAVKDDLQKAIYASSFKPTGVYFPLVWNENIKYVYAANVSSFYTDLYRSHLTSISSDGKHIPLRVMMFGDNQCVQNSDNRIAANVDVFCGKSQMGGGRTAGATQDMNDVLTFMLEKNQVYNINYADAEGIMKSIEVKLGEEPREVKLYMK